MEVDLLANPDPAVGQSLGCDRPAVGTGRAFGLLEAAIARCSARR